MPQSVGDVGVPRADLSSLPVRDARVPADDAARAHTERALSAIVRDRPGIHFRELMRVAGVRSAGILRAHLDGLVEAGTLAEVPDGRYRRYFARERPGAQLPGGLARFTRPLPRAVGRQLLTRPMTRGELKRRLACADSSLGACLKRMLEAHDVTRVPGPDGERFALTDPTLVRRALGGAPAHREKAASALVPAR